MSAMNWRLRYCARKSGSGADASFSPQQASRRVRFEKFIGHPLQLNHTTPSNFTTHA